MSFSLNTYVIATSTIAMLGTFFDFFKIDVTSLTGLVNKSSVKPVSTTEILGGGAKRKQTKTRKRKYNRKK
jgi:hypothetical protein